jgi:hypothetical protein
MLRLEEKFCFAHNQKQTRKSRSWRTEHNSDREENNSFRSRILPIALFGRIVLRSNKQVSMMGDDTIVRLLLLYCSHEYYVCLLKNCYVDCEKFNSFRLRIVRIAIFGRIVLRSNKQVSMIVYATAVIYYCSHGLYSTITSTQKLLRQGLLLVV